MARRASQVRHFLDQRTRVKLYHEKPGLAAGADRSALGCALMDEVFGFMTALLADIVSNHLAYAIGRMAS